MIKSMVIAILVANAALAAEKYSSQIDPQKGLTSQVLTRYGQGSTGLVSKLTDRDPVREKFDTNTARMEINKLVERIKQIGKSAQPEPDPINEIDSDEEEITLSSLGMQGEGAIVDSGILTPFFKGDISIISLPKDPVDKFDHAKWIVGLSSKNAGGTYAEIGKHTSYTLADNVKIGAKYCNDHSDNQGHSYSGTSYCCQYYTRGIRRELIDIAAVASRHNRAHDAYVKEFEYFEKQVALLHAHSSALSIIYPGVFLNQAYPQKPDLTKHDNHYILFKFSDWLLEIASNNSGITNTVTDRDDPGVMADKVYVSSRHGACGHGTAHQYTGWNWCCGAHHVRSIRVEIFDVALKLEKNQKNHDNYVRDTVKFAAEAELIIENFWKSLQKWNGVAVKPVSPHNLKNKKALSSNQTTSKKALELFSIADNVSSVGEKLCTEVDAYNQDRSHISTKGEIIQVITTDLQKTNELLLSQLTDLESKNAELAKQIANNDWADRERTLRAEFAKVLESREKADSTRDRKFVANFLGNLLYGLKCEENEQDIDRFKDFSSFEDMVTRANTLILKPVEKMAKKMNKINKKSTQT